jgi:dTDP-4-dehydrorhamnose reductase
MRILVVGGDSPIGAAFVSALVQRRDAVFATTRRPGTARSECIFLDLADSSVDKVELPQVDAAFFCAAVSGFAHCRADPALARRVNVEGTSRLARRLVAQGTYVVLLSSTAVFDFQTPHVTADTPVSPRTLHGQIKVEAEKVFLQVGDLGSVLRLTKVLTPDASLMAGWIAALRRNEPVTAFSDLHLAPISLDDATSAMNAVAEDRGSGIYQMSGARDISYFEAARHLAKMMGRPAELVQPKRAADTGIPAEDIARFTTLESSRIEGLTGRLPPDPRAVIEAVYAPQVSRARVET